MSATKEYEVETLIYELTRSYPYWPSTFGPCSEGCGKSARGCGKCADCLEKMLAERVGDELAWEIHAAITYFAELRKQAMEAVK